MYEVFASRVLVRLRDLLSNAMILLALFYFLCAPTLDSLAKEDTLGASPSLIERVVASFDVVADVLDAFSPQKPTVAQHQVVAPVLPDLPVQIGGRIVMAVVWTWALPLPPAAATPAVPSPPPRA